MVFFKHILVSTLILIIFICLFAQVSEITRKPPDVVSIALHDCSYDTNLAIQNILEGFYEDTLEVSIISSIYTY